MLAGPIARSEIVVLYALSKLTNGLINCFNVSGPHILTSILFIIRLALIVLYFNYQITIFARQRKIF